MFVLLFEAVEGAPHPELMFAHVNSEFRITRVISRPDIL